MIDPQTVAKIHDAAKIDEVVGDFVSLRKRGANLVGLCPFHNEKTGSFNVSPARGIFKCFGCGEGGNAVRFLMLHEHLSYPDALRYLAKKYHIEIVEKELTDEEKSQLSDRDNMLNVNEFAVNYFVKNLEKDEGRAVGRAYLHERGFSDDIIAKFALGYSVNSYDDFYNEAHRRGFADKYLVATGLVFKNDKGTFTDRFRGRVMFPIHSLAGKVIGFGGRILEKNDKLAKYVNSPESEIYNKSNELYGIFFAKNQIVKQDRCFLVEGYTDVISMHQAGVENVVASSGTSLTDGQIKLIHRFTQNITVIYDGDAAGIKASIRGIDMLLEYGMNIKAVLLPDGDDPDSFARKNNASDFIEYIERHQVDFIEFKINMMSDEAKNDPVKKAAMIGDVIKSIAIIPNQIIRATYVKECASRLEIDEAVIYNEINKILRKRHEDEFKRRESQTNRAANALQNTATQAPDNESATLQQATRKDRNALYKHEKELIRFVVREGQKRLVEADNGQGYLNVGEYIYNVLNNNGLHIQTPVFARILEEFHCNADRAEFDCENYFKNHADLEINALAIEFLTDKYIVGKRFASRPPTEAIDIPDIVDDDPRSEVLHSFAKLRLEKEKDKQRLEETEALRQLKSSLDKLILEYVNALLNNELSAYLKQIESSPDTHIDDFISTLHKRHELVCKHLKDRVVVKIK